MALALRALLVTALLGFAGSVHAATVTVLYDLGASTLEVTDPLALTVPSDQITGTMEIAYAADDAGNILLDGASSVELRSFDVALSLDLLSGLVTGPVSIALLGPVAGGSLSSGGVVSFAGAPDASIDTVGTVSCNSSAFVCSIAGLDPGANPIAETIVQPFSDLLFAAPFDPAALHVLGASIGVTTPVVGTLELAATETGRTFTASVPEPGTFLLLCAGLVGLGAYGRPRRRETA
jgi:hypothetical protein